MIERIYVSDIMQGDAITVLRDRFADESVQCCVTSPPYWGLRDYGTAEWDGGDDDCNHVAPPSGGKLKGSTLAGTGNRNGFSADGQYRQTCGKCGAVRIDQQLGLEATPELYVSKMVEVFREVRRVLKADGTLWLNLGDSYAGSGQGWMKDGTVVGGPKQKTNFGSMQRMASTVGFDKPRNYISSRQDNGLKPKDLVGIPWRVAFALQADGWYLRSDIIWHKPNPMPESVTDRPTKAHEYIFLMSKSERYYYDAEAIKEPAIYADEARYDNGLNGHGGGVSHVGQGSSTRKFKADKQRGHGRRHDGFNDRWDQMTKTEQCSNFRNKRTVWTIATQPYSEAHFATFPPKLIEPCILAGCPTGGLVLDPFVGSGTTIQVAQQLGRRGVGIELNPAYIALAERRIAQTGLAL